MWPGFYKQKVLVSLEKQRKLVISKQGKWKNKKCEKLPNFYQQNLREFRKTVQNFLISSCFYTFPIIKQTIQRVLTLVSIKNSLLSFTLSEYAKKSRTFQIAFHQKHNNNRFYLFFNIKNYYTSKISYNFNRKFQFSTCKPNT
jgi:hypothetical protein